MKYYELNEDCVKNKPELFDKTGIRPRYTLEVSKQKMISYVTKEYDFVSNIDEIINNIKEKEDVKSLDYYMFSSLIKGLEEKRKINYRAQKRAENG